MFDNLGRAWDLQRDLNRAQTIPLVGPLVISPLKALVSVVQIIAGIAASVFLGASWIVFGHQDLAIQSIEALCHVSFGIFSLGYSLANFFTLGIASRYFEDLSAYSTEH